MVRPADPSRGALPVLLPLSLLLCVAVLAGARPAVAPPQERSAPADTDWVAIRPGGATTCQLDEEFRFYARAASPDDLVVFFYGGGACWNGELCVPEVDSIYRTQVRGSPESYDGIFDLDDPRNPVAGYSMVAVPYCTGDVHLGDRDETYTLERDGETRSYTVHHRGLVNGRAVLDWIAEHFPGPTRILVTGSSAGGVATPFYADRLARRYPDARVIGVGDGAGSYRSDVMVSVEPWRWGVPDALRRYPGWEALPDSVLGVERLFQIAARGAPNLELYQFDQAHDAGQRRYLVLAGSPQTDPLPLLQRNRRDIRAVDPDFRAFTVGGDAHTVMTSAPFYFYEVDGRGFRDWLADILAGEPVESHACTDCRSPDFAFGPADLDVMNRALEIFPDAGAWDPDHEGTCPGQPGPLSLRCGLIRAARDQGHSPGEMPAFYEVIYTVLERMDADEPIRRPLVRFNNLDSTGFDDIRSVLLQVRDHIAAELHGHAP